MRQDSASTAHFRAVIADFVRDRSRLESDIESARQALRSKEQALEDVNRVIAALEHRLGDAPSTQEPSSTMVTPPISRTMGIGEACVTALKVLGGRASNGAILNALRSSDYVVSGSNPLNNVGASMNHRAKTKGDVVRDGRDWVIAQGKVQGASAGSDIATDRSTLQGAECLNGESHPSVKAA